MAAPRTFRAVLLAVLLAIQLPGVAAAQGRGPLWDKIRDSGKLVCGAMPAYPIVSYSVDGPRRYEGYAAAFCRAIVAALSTEMGKPIDIAWQETSWANLVLDLQSGRIDIFAGMTATEERKKALDMAGPMYELAECVINRKGFPGFSTWEGYNDPKVRIAVTAGTSEEKLVRRVAAKAEIVAFKEVAEAVLAIQSGRADALPLAITTCLNTMKRAAAVFGGYVVPEPVHSDSSAAGMRKDGDGRFAAWLQKWAEESRANGTVKAIFIEQMKLANYDLANLPAGLKF